MRIETKRKLFLNNLKRHFCSWSEVRLYYFNEALLTVAYSYMFKFTLFLTFMCNHTS